uniref:Uncharacterized protein n=1 Tax=Anopheles minimus TaxID=112268 RepID=A0A182WPV3_9DIPT
ALYPFGGTSSSSSRTCDPGGIIIILLKKSGQVGCVPCTASAGSKFARALSSGGFFLVRLLCVTRPPLFETVCFVTSPAEGRKAGSRG